MAGDKPQDQPSSWETLGETAKFVGNALTFFPRMSGKIMTGKIDKADDLPTMLGKMAPKTGEPQFKPRVMNVGEPIKKESF